MSSRWTAISDFDYLEERGDPVGRMSHSERPKPGSGQYLSKGDSRKRIKGREDRAEKKTKTQVRAECVDRDGYCRVAEMMRTLCNGPSQWTHLEDKRRCFTRGMKPTDRHSTQWTCQMCQGHHAAYDAHHFDVRFIDEDKGADGAIEVVYRS